VDKDIRFWNWKAKTKHQTKVRVQWLKINIFLETIHFYCASLYYKEWVLLKTRFTESSTPLPLTGGPTCHKSPTKTVLPDDERVVTIFSTFENTFGDFGFLFSPGRSLPAPCTHIFILEGVVALFTRLVYPHFHFGRFYILPPNTHISFPPWLMVSIICFLSFPWLIVSFKVLGASLPPSN
jgi:hypothetical protein